VSVILIMIPAALLLAGLGIFAFVLAVKKGQFDDLDTPALRAVFDDENTSSNTNASQAQLENKTANKVTNKETSKATNEAGSQTDPCVNQESRSNG
jgi:cbb3-type cytochrome oxidase maturation protein